MSKEEDFKLVKVEFEIRADVVKFLKEYLAFLGRDWTVGDLCRDMIYGDVNALHDELGALTYYNGDDFFKKYPYILITKPIPEETKEKDC